MLTLLVQKWNFIFNGIVIVLKNMSTHMVYGYAHIAKDRVELTD